MSNEWLSYRILAVEEYTQYDSSVKTSGLAERASPRYIRDNNGQIDLRLTNLGILRVMLELAYSTQDLFRSKDER